MKPRDDQLNLRRSGGGIYKVQLEIPIDEYGQPKIDQVHFRGTIPASAQQDVIAWIIRGTFVPATRNGVRVPGTFTLNL